MRNKCAVVTEAQKECTCAASALANSLQDTNSGSNWRLSSEQVAFLRAIFALQHSISTCKR